MRNIFIVITLSLLTSCSGVPRRQLTSEEKKADLYWLFSMFNQNYAPMQYKEQLHKFSIEDLKASYLEKAAQTKTNDEFYALMHSFVAHFQDAHTSGSFSPSALPQRVQVAYLGFSGVRIGKKFHVKSLLPSIKDTSSFPIKVGTIITKFNGKSIADAVQTELVPYRNLGHTEANITALANNLFQRNSTGINIPTEDNVTLTLEISSKEQDVILPWIKKDIYTFSKEQAEAKKEKDSKEKQSNLFAVLLESFQKADLVSQFFQKEFTREGGHFDFRKSFRVLGLDTSWSSDQLKEQLERVLAGPNGFAPATPKTTKEILAKSRFIPANALFIPEAKTYPAYITKVKTDKNGSHLVAYMHLNTFSPATAEDKVIEEVKATLKVISSLNVNKLVIDMIGNGGGSLSLGVKLAQALSNKPIQLPTLQFKTSETWLDEFENASISNSSDAERELAKRIFYQLDTERRSGKSLSKAFNIESLMPFEVSPNTDLEEPLKIVFLADEMCASMCDIFSGMLVDNKMATFLGKQTMGAGGNVVMHGAAPNSGFLVAQTESLIIRSNGSYIENNGIKPDVVVEINEHAGDNYSAVIQKALKHISEN